MDLQKTIFLTGLISALVRLGAQQIFAESSANDYCEKVTNKKKISEKKVSVEDAVKEIVSEVADKLEKETKVLETQVKKYKSIFEKEPYLGQPIGEMSLFDQTTQIQHQIKSLKSAISSKTPILDEPKQKMGVGLPPPLFCTGLNHCSIASMLSFISYCCFFLGYSGEAPSRSFSMTFGKLFKESLKVASDRCIVIEDIFKNLQQFLQLLKEQYPPYSPFLGRIFSTFSSRTFKKLIHGGCSPIEGGKNISSNMTILEESVETLSTRIQNALLSCGSEEVHTHLQMTPGVVSAFGLPCAMPNDCGGLIPQVPLTANSLKEFKLFGTSLDGCQFELKSRVCAAICDTRGRNQMIAAEQAKVAGTSHYYLIICKDSVWYCVDSSRTNVFCLSNEDALKSINKNGIVIFTINEVDQQFQGNQAVSEKSSQRAVCGGGAVALPSKLSPQKSSQRAVGGGGGAVALPSKPSPQKSSAVSGTDAPIPHHPSPCFGHTQNMHEPIAIPQFLQKLQQLFPYLVISHLFNHNPVIFSRKYCPTDDEQLWKTELLSSARFDALSKGCGNSAFVYQALNLTYEDVSNNYRLVPSFEINLKMFRLTAVVYKDDHFVAYPEIKSLPEGERRNELRKSFLADIQQYSFRNPSVPITRMLFEPCV